MEERILFVDDDPNILEAYQRKLQHVLRVHTAQGPHLGLREIQERGPFAVVVADMNMPLMNGVEFLRKVQEIAPETVRMMLTGHADLKTAMQAVNEGSVFRFLTKPCPSKLMGDSLAAGIRQYRLITGEKELLEGTLGGTAELLTEILSWVSSDAFDGAKAMRDTALLIAEKIHAGNQWQIGLAATLSQLGLLAMPLGVRMREPEAKPLTMKERKSLESVPGVGKELVERIPRLEEVAEIILYQDKHYDGSAFPDGKISGEQIPLGARILKAAKDFHELHTGGMQRASCLREMRARKGHYDPKILQALEAVAPRDVPKPEKSTTEVISLSDLRPGHILAAPILTREGRKLIATNTEISKALLVRLCKYLETSGVIESATVRIPPKETD